MAMYGHGYGVAETSVTTGTGSYLLQGALERSGITYRTFEGQIDSGTTIEYSVYNGTDLEVAEGVYTESEGTRTLSRDKVLYSTNDGDKVNWAAGTKVIQLIVAKPVRLNVAGNRVVMPDTAGTLREYGLPTTATTLVGIGGSQTINGEKTFATTPKMDAIAERTEGSGVTVDGVLLKDGGATFSGGVSGTSAAFSGDVTVASYRLLTSFAADAGTTPDLDSITTPGTYGITAGVNAPGSGNGVLFVLQRTGSGVIWQWFLDMANPPVLWFRRSSWSAWQRVITDGVASQTITGPLTVRASNDGASTAPVFVLDRISASPAANDALGTHRFNGSNSTGGTVNYIDITTIIDDPTAGAESGTLRISTRQAGTTTYRVSIGNGMYMRNATGGDMGLGTINATGYYVNGALIKEVRHYESGNIVLTSETDAAMNHGLGGVPGIVGGYLVCTTADAGYAVGDRIPLSSLWGTDGGASARKISVGANSTQVFYSMNTSNLGILHKTNQSAVTPVNSNWRLRIYALRVVD